MANEKENYNFMTKLQYTVATYIQFLFNHNANFPKLNYLPTLLLQHNAVKIVK